MATDRQTTHMMGGCLSSLVGRFYRQPIVSQVATFKYKRYDKSLERFVRGPLHIKRDSSVNTRPGSISVCLALIFLNALIWLAFGIIVAANVHPALPDSPLIKTSMAFLAFVTAAILLSLFYLLSKQNRSAYFIALAILAIVSVVTLFDNFGWVDFIVLVIGLIPLILLIKDRAWYLGVKPEPEENQRAT